MKELWGQNKDKITGLIYLYTVAEHIHHTGNWFGIKKKPISSSEHADSYVPPST